MGSSCQVHHFHVTNTAEARLMAVTLGLATLLALPQDSHGGKSFPLGLLASI